jgi:hypothetical protein
MEEECRPLMAYALSGADRMPIVAAPCEREWMDLADQRYPYRCLPLAIANQAGWLILNPVTFEAVWNGGPGKADVKIQSAEETSQVVSHFGLGTITFRVPYLFRTPAGVNLWVKGPSNWIKDGVQPLEGVVETDWLIATFTMNWKITRVRQPVTFERGEPICMIIPATRGLAESLDPICAAIADDPDLSARLHRWQEERAEFNAKLEERNPEAAAQGWQRDYFLGRDGGSGRVAQHQTRLNLRQFSSSVAGCRRRQQQPR